MLFHDETATFFVLLLTSVVIVIILFIPFGSGQDFGSPTSHSFSHLSNEH